MAWFNKSKAPIAPVETKKVQMPEGIWTKCKNCNEIIYTKEIERNLNVCPKCDYHFRISARERIALVLDDGSFVELDAAMQSTDFLDFKDSKRYKDRIKAAVKKSGGDAVIAYEPATGKEIWRCAYDGYSLVPRPVADRYVRLARRGAAFDVHPLSYRQLDALVRSAGFGATYCSPRIAAVR